MPRRVPTLRPRGHSPSSRLYRLRPDRAEDNRFYCSTEWRRLRASVLASHPLCEDCLKTGRTTAAAHVHHKLPRKERPDLALDRDNLEALCQPCHNARPVR